MKEEIKGVVMDLHEMGREAAGCISLVQSALVSGSPSLKDCCEKLESLELKGPALTAEIAEKARDRAELKEYLAIPAHIQRILEEIRKIAGLLEKKTKENILFSDRAVTELSFLFQRLLEILRPTSDIILVRNTILAGYVRESENEIVGAANDYATQHEERLVEGLCLPIASALYLAILDSVKGIAWHAKEISVRLAE